MSFRYGIFTLDTIYDEHSKLMRDVFNLARFTNKLVYRGISRDSELFPNVMRVRSSSPSEITTVNLSKKEFPMLRDFKKHASSFVNGTLSAIDFVSLAQHFGIPTALVDWSHNPFVALYFSLNTSHSIGNDFSYRLLVCEKEKQIVFDDVFGWQTVGEYSFNITNDFVTAYERFSQTIVDAEKVEELCNTRGIEFSEKNKNGLIMIEPNNSNQRVISQSGIFSLPRSRDKNRIKEEYSKAGITTIIISEKARLGALRELERLGYSRLKLFFDLQNICQYIKDCALDPERS